MVTSMTRDDRSVVVTSVSSVVKLFPWSHQLIIHIKNSNEIFHMKKGRPILVKRLVVGHILFNYNASNKGRWSLTDHYNAKCPVPEDWHKPTLPMTLRYVFRQVKIRNFSHWPLPQTDFFKSYCPAHKQSKEGSCQFFNRHFIL